MADDQTRKQKPSWTSVSIELQCCDFHFLSSRCFSSKTLLWPCWFCFIGLGRAGLSARDWCNYIVNSHCVRYCELYTGCSLYLSHFQRWHYTRSTLLLLLSSLSLALSWRQTLKSCQGDSDCVCLKNIWLIPFYCCPLFVPVTLNLPSTFATAFRLYSISLWHNTSLTFLFIFSVE